jgi:hypothetical protein
MIKIFGFTLLYLLAALSLLFGLQADISQVRSQILELAGTQSVALITVATYIAPALLVGMIYIIRRYSYRRLLDLGLITLAVVMMQVGFAIFKTAMPKLVPFYADPGLADLDQWLMGGVYPWVLVHHWMPQELGLKATTLYYQLWVVPAMGLPLLIVATENDRARMMRYCWLYFGIWLVLGNIVALLGNSVGPVFYDRLIGGDRFAALTAALVQSGVTGSWVGQVQNALWASYTTGADTPGLGISAFPSVHVAIASFTAIYLGERSKYLALPGALFLALIFVLSIYTGFHYLVDGLFSFAAVLLGNWALKRRMAPATDATLLRPIAA